MLCRVDLAISCSSKGIAGARGQAFGTEEQASGAWFQYIQRDLNPKTLRFSGGMMSTLAEDLMITKPPVRGIEWRIVQAYVSLAVVRKGVAGECTEALVRYGPYEVRLVERMPIRRDDALPFWLELFDHTRKRSLDSFGSHRLEEVADAAEVLISIAESLHEKESS